MTQVNASAAPATQPPVSPQTAPQATLRDLPRQSRAASLAPSTFDESTRTVEVVWTTGARVRRYDYWAGQSYDEELVVSDQAIDMSRLGSGAAPVLNTHSQWTLDAQIGVVDRAWIANGEGRAMVRLSARPELAGLVQDIRDGIVRNISVGYNVRKYEVISAANRTDGGTVPLYRAIDWTPAEVSFVPVPADAASGTRSHTPAAQPGSGDTASHGSQPCEFIGLSPAQPSQENRMGTQLNHAGAGGQPEPVQPTIAPAAGAPGGAANEPQSRAAPAAAPAQPGAATAAAQDILQRTSEIAELCLRHGAAHLAPDFLRNGATIDQVRAGILDWRAANDATAGGHRNVNVQTVTDQLDVRMEGIEGAIMHRLDPKAKLSDNARLYRGQSMLQLGADMLEAHGINTRGLDRLTLATRILQGRGYMGTGDFSNIMSNVANKRLRGAYEENAGTYTLWARRAPNAPDFKNITVNQLSGAPDLLQTNEHGEFKYGSMKDGAETYNLVTFGRIVSLSRQALINDDLRAFDRLVTAYGYSAKRLENRMVYLQLTGPTTLSDNLALFEAPAHKNLATGAPSALSFDALSKGRAAMRVQKGLQGEELNIVPATLIVPTALEQTAYQLTSSNYVPAKQADVNEFRQGGRTSLEVVVEPVLDATSTTAWYLASNSGQIDTVEYCYLDGAEGPVIESEMGFEVDGVSWKCRLDFAARAIDYRGLYKAAGA